jgi:hypothetical protein
MPPPEDVADVLAQRQALEKDRSNRNELWENDMAAAAGPYSGIYRAKSSIHSLPTLNSPYPSSNLFLKNNIACDSLYSS